MKFCDHKNKELVESYYSDTEWCPDCGAVRGNDGLFGPKSKMLSWKIPKVTKAVHECEGDGGCRAYKHVVIPD